MGEVIGPEVRFYSLYRCHDCSRRGGLLVEEAGTSVVIERRAIVAVGEEESAPLATVLDHHAIAVV